MYWNCYFIDGKAYRISTRIIKEVLWKANPNCRFCGVRTVILKQNGKSSPAYDPKMATIEHLYSRYNPKRSVGFNRNKVTLACAKCNNDRQKKEADSLGIEEIRRRSKLGERK